MAVRFPPFQVVPFGMHFMLRCAECGELKQVYTRDEGRSEGRDHQRWSHPTDEEREQDDLREYELTEMTSCARCGHDDHVSKNCPIVTPDLLKRTP